ncbi:B12-binding domain-containing radical SAM protein [Micromonospora sp. B11E3]|uniref:B12-binding domain-containing radical SAM protein n=1 Tax=Micromonospora sp. B11E3 TaxID=3153562 RepID=UPI00325E3597
MPSRPTVVHHHFANPPAAAAADQQRLLARRTTRGARLRAGEPGDGPLPHWAARRFPVLAALAPVMTSTEGEITYPGDPMCLYTALSVTVDEALTSAARGPRPDAPFPDLCPDWGRRPDTAYRLGAEHGPRPWRPDDPNTDTTVFDPRVWDDRARAELQAEVRRRQPRVFLVSTVSPGHRYALEMARIVKREVPSCLVVFGGRHIDETIRYVPQGDRLALEYSSTVRAIDDGRCDPVVDLLVAGDGYFALALLMRAIAQAMDLDDRSVGVPEVVAMLDLLGSAGERVPSTSLICALTEEAVHAFPISGPRYDLGELPSPYQGFAIRARFPIFPRPDGTPSRTAHMMVSNACPYHCSFCSEAATLSGGLRRFGRDPAAAALERVCEYVSYGAEAVFFDDSIFWSGNFPNIRAFCTALTQARSAERIEDLPQRCRHWITTDDALARLRQLQFGCQVTADLMTTLHKESDVQEILTLMREAGCTYVYMGIESLSAQVMDNVHKNVRRVEGFGWENKVRTALERIRDAGIPVGSSVLFGLHGEDQASIAETIEGVGRLIDDGLLVLASPNILTYHPATAITRMHGVADQLDYHSPKVENRPPYTFFEEAFPGVVSRQLDEADIWHIHQMTEKRWGSQRNSAAADEMYAAPTGA